MAACPLCWLRTHGFPEIPTDHGREWWEWLRQVSQTDPKVKKALAEMPLGIVKEKQSEALS